MQYSESSDIDNPREFSHWHITLGLSTTSRNSGGVKTTKLVQRNLRRVPRRPALCGVLMISGRVEGGGERMDKALERLSGIELALARGTRSARSRAGTVGVLTKRITARL